MVRVVAIFPSPWNIIISLNCTVNLAVTDNLSVHGAKVSIASIFSEYLSFSTADKKYDS